MPARDNAAAPAASGLIATFVHHRNAANLLMALMLLAGAFALLKMNTQFFPTVEIPRVTITIVWPGASAEDVESNILAAVEPEVRFLDGIKEVVSYAREGSGTVSIEYEQSADMQKAQSDVEQAVAAITTLPEESEEPVIQRNTWYEVVAKVSLSGPFGEEALREYAKTMRDGLLSAGISRVDLEGLRDQELWIEISPQDLRRLDLTLSDVARRVAVNSRDLPSGTLQGAVERQIRSIAEAETPNDFGAIEIRSLAGGEKIRLRDIARLETRFERDQSQGYLAGQRAIELTIQRSKTSDTLQSARILDDYLEKVRPTLPPTLQVQKYDVRADLLDERIALLVNNGVSGLILVLIVLFVFLNWRVAFWVAAGIPVAMMMTLAIMYVSGQTINMMSLFALILTLGIIVDDAIVVGEHTATLHAEGQPPAVAAEGGVRRMLAPVTAASLTTMAAFFPLFLVRDTLGQIMSALPLVVIAVLAASLIESFFILPGHLRHSMRHMNHEPGWFRRNFDRGFARFRDGPFRAMVVAAFQWRYATVAGALGALILSAGLLAGGQVRFQFFPSPEPENISAEVVFGAGIPNEDAVRALAELEQSLLRVENRLTEGKGGVVRNFFTVLGKAGQSRGSNLATIEVQLTPSEQRSVRTYPLVGQWYRGLPKIPGVERVTIQARRGGPPGRDIDVRLQNASPGVLKQAALEVRDELNKYVGVSSVADDLPYGKEELVLELSARGTALGFTIEDVGTQVRNSFEGAIAKRFAKGDEEVTVRVMQAEEERRFEALRELYLRSPAGRRVPLSEVADIRSKTGFSLIQRRDGKTTVSVTGDVDQNTLTSQDLVQSLASGPLPEIARKYGIEIAFSGREEERKKSFADLRIGLMLALGVIYLILAWVFASYSRPLAVMLIIPFGFIGAMLGHWFMGFPLTIMSFMALLGLSGILVNDSIILVSRMDERIAQGEPLHIAAIASSQDRLRAVLLTSLTTIGGLLPMMFEQSLQARFLSPMAVTLVFGLGVATFLVLFLVPAFVGVGSDIVRTLRWLYGRRRPLGEAAE